MRIKTTQATALVWAHVVICISWLALVGLTFAPGTLSTDSLEQYVQGLTQDYTNLHPPAYSLLLSLSGALSGSPLLVFYAQLLLLAVGSWLAASRLAGVAAPIAQASFLLLPPIWAVGIAIWKDVFFGVVLLLGAVLIVERRRRWASWFCLGVAVLMRHNAIVAVTPLAAMLVSDATPFPRRRAAIAVAATLCLLTAGPAIELVTGARQIWPAGQLYIFAIGGVATRAKLELADYPGLTSRYVDDAVTPLIGVPPGEPWSVDFLSRHREAISRDAVKLVSEHPLDFAQHRLAVFATLLGLGRETVCAPFHPGIDANSLGFAFDPRFAKLRETLVSFRDATQNGLLFRGWFWLSVELALLAALLKQRAFRYALVAGSGLIYSLSFLIAAPSCDFRYLYWTVLSTCLAAAGLFARPSAGKLVARPPL